MAYLERIPVGDFPAIVNMLGEKGSKKLGYNTYLEWRKGAHSKGCIGIRYNSTFVVTYYHDGNIELNSGGCKTRTTKQRIVHGLPGGWSLSQRDSVWYLSNGSVDWQFADGIIIVPDGTVVSGANRTLREIFALKEKCGICGRGLVDGQCPDDTGFPEPPEELKSFIVGKDYVNTSYVRVMAKNEGEAKQKAEGGGPLVIGIQDQFKCWLDCDQWSVQEDK